MEEKKREKGKLSKGREGGKRKEKGFKERRVVVKAFYHVYFYYIIQKSFP